MRRRVTALIAAVRRQYWMVRLGRQRCIPLTPPLRILVIDWTTDRGLWSCSPDGDVIAVHPRWLAAARALFPDAEVTHPQ